ncbi:hypothetical protein [Bacillus badius]|uniref:Mobile element protein n=1 Tax=Bacillus badius TaxID=1455 RepID=A0ABR5AUX3_BACBA|nr:hypothetical protein [Bacillus badius]KIL76414.1 hypothetical protein SD78_0516 [Bacillus badius]KIL78532.1 hypothetical protein SD77_4212 [Bacillus badius]MED4715955.1 hypothetical protein [Bacillus badius]
MSKKRGLASLVKLALKYGPLLYPIVKKMLDKRKTARVMSVQK